MPPLAAKSVVILGGTSGIGLSAARACRDAGASVTVAGRDDDHAAAARGEFAVVVGDAADAKLAEEAIDQAGRLDALYHVAGGSGRRLGDGPLHDVTDAGIDATLAMNLSSVVKSNRAAVNRFREQGGGGSVLNVGSVLADSPSPRFFSTCVYAAAKAGIVGLTKSCAAYYAAENIRFNVIAPGLVETPMSGRAAGDAEIMAFVKAKQPLDGGRIGDPSDLDAAAVWLLGDGSRFVTGQVIAVDGGWSVSEGGAS